MPSYHGGQRTGRARPRHDDVNRWLATLADTAALLRRHPNTVRNHCPHVACDVATRAYLYDVEAAAEALSTRRVKRGVACDAQFV